MNFLLLLGLVYSSVKLFYTRTSRNETQLILSVPRKLANKQHLNAHLFRNPKDPKPVKELSQVNKPEDVQYYGFARDLKADIKREFYLPKDVFTLIVNTSKNDAYFFRFYDKERMLFESDSFKFEKTETDIKIKSGTNSLTEVNNTFIEEENADIESINNTKFTDNKHPVILCEENNNQYSEPENLEALIIEPEITKIDVTSLDKESKMPSKINNENLSADNKEFLEENEKSTVETEDQSTNSPTKKRSTSEIPSDHNILKTQSNYVNGKKAPEEKMPFQGSSSVENHELTFKDIKHENSMISNVMKLSAAFGVTTFVGLLIINVLGY